MVVVMMMINIIIIIMVIVTIQLAHVLPDLIEELTDLSDDLTVRASAFCMALSDLIITLSLTCEIYIKIFLR